MSADNWTYCPRCTKSFFQKRKKFYQKIEDSYGTIPAIEYMDLIEKAKNPVKQEETLREDYEIGHQNNEFYIIYKACCQKCDYTFKFKHEEIITI